MRFEPSLSARAGGCVLAALAVLAPAVAVAEPAPPPTVSLPEVPDTLDPPEIDAETIDEWSEFFSERSERSQQLAGDVLGGEASRADAFYLSWDNAVRAAEANPLEAPELALDRDLPAPSLDSSLGLFEPPSLGTLDDLYGPARQLPPPPQVGNHPAVDVDGILGGAHTGCRLTDPSCRSQVLDQRLGNVVDTALSASPAMALFAQVSDAHFNRDIAEAASNSDYSEFPDSLDAEDLTHELVELGITQEDLHVRYCEEEDYECPDVSAMADEVLDGALSGPGRDEAGASNANRYLASGISQDPELAAQHRPYDLAWTLSQVLLGDADPSDLERFGELTPDEIGDAYQVTRLLVDHNSTEEDWAPDLGSLPNCRDEEATEDYGACSGWDPDPMIHTTATRLSGDASVDAPLQDTFTIVAGLAES